MAALRNAIRSLRRSPGFALVSVLSLGLALGLVATVFGLVDALRHPRTAIHEPEQLFEVRIRGNGASGQVTAADHMQVVEERIPAIREVAYWTFTDSDALETNRGRIQALGWRVSANYFSVLGVRPIAGRVFSSVTADEDAAASVVISERIWRNVFDADPRLERLAISIDGSEGISRAQVIGVVPEELAAETRVNFWLSMPRDVGTFAVTQRFVVPIARLRPGATIDSLNPQLELAREYLSNAHGSGRIAFRVTARPMTHDPLRIGEFEWLLVGAAIAVLLIACSNLANLVFARGLARQQDMAVRLSLGARRSDIVKGVLAECVLVSVGGAALGLLAATWGFDLLRSSMPERMPTGMLVLSMSWRVAAMSSGAAVIAGVLFGLLPALRLSDVHLATHVKEQSGTTTGRHRGRFPVLVIGQVALSLAMLTGVTLMLRASHVTRSIDFGFDPARLLSVSVSSRSPRDTSQAARLAMWSAAETRLRSYPQVEAVAWQAGISLYRAPSITGERSGGAMRTRYLTSYTHVSPNYLRTIGVPVIHGRDFEDHDALGEGVVIVDSVTALRIWGSEDPIGRLLKFAPEERISPWFRVVGVSRPMRSGLPRHEGEDAAPQVYMAGKEAFVPSSERLRPLIAGLPHRQFVVRASPHDIAALRTHVPHAMRDAIPPGGRVNVFGFDDQRQNLIANQRFLARVFGTFGLLSLALCAIGLYSVLAYSVNRRLREHGIRVALGATSRHVFLDVLHEGAILVVAGTAVGGLATIWSNRLVDPYIGLLYHVDALALVAAEFVLVGVALAAMVRPAIRATRTDPVQVLRAV